MRLKAFISELNTVADEYRICRTACTRLHTAIGEDPILAERLEIDRGSLTKTIRRLEHSFIVRLFSAFEGTLRELWANSFKRATEPPMRDLLDALAAANCFMPPATLALAHHVREFRNAIVHLNATRTIPLPFKDCENHLKAYLSFMPRNW